MTPVSPCTDPPGIDDLRPAAYGDLAGQAHIGSFPYSSFSGPYGPENRPSLHYPGPPPLPVPHYWVGP
jgi:hypothetical protein